MKRPPNRPRGRPAGKRTPTLRKLTNVRLEYPTLYELYDYCDRNNVTIRETTEKALHRLFMEDKRIREAL